MSEFDDIQGLLADILDESKPLPASKPAGKPTKPSKAPLPASVRGAITEVAIETFDPELLEIAAEEQALSSVAAAPQPSKAPRPRKGAQQTVSRVVEAVARAEVTQGVTDDDEPMEAALADAKGAIFADTEDRKREETEELLRIPMPEFTSADLASTIDIRNFATLVTLNTARWHAKVKDRKASRDAATANDADENAFETRKRLLVGADEQLKSIHKAIDAARSKHYDMTLPWTTKGVDDLGRRTGARLLPNTLFFEYTKEMAECKAEMKRALDAFVPMYPELIKLAQTKLGRRFDPAEYPNMESIRNHFDLSFDFQPVPQGDDFKGLPQQQIEALATTINRKTQTMMENAMQDVWVRLYKAVTHMYDRIASPDKTFHYTMTENVREVTRLLKHLNVTQDVGIEKIRKYLDKHVCPHDADTLRKNNVLRQQVAAHVQNVIDRMREIGGVS